MSLRLRPRAGDIVDVDGGEKYSMYSSTKSKDEFLKRTAEERQSRAAQKVSSSAAVKIQVSTGPHTPLDLL